MTIRRDYQEALYRVEHQSPIFAQRIRTYVERLEERLDLDLQELDHDFHIWCAEHGVTDDEMSDSLAWYAHDRGLDDDQLALIESLY